MLGEPALVVGDGRRDAQRVALLAQQRVAAVAGAVAPDLAGLGEVRDVLGLVARPRRRRPGPRRAGRRPSGGTSRSRRRRPSNSGSTSAPMRVMIFIDATTYSESVISTPSIGVLGVERAHAERDDVHRAAAHAAAVRSVIVVFISAGSTQLLVGPASVLVAVQMKVRSSTRATSSGSEAAQNELGFFSSFSLTKVPASTSCGVTRSHSSAEPSHHTTRSGMVRSATSRTQVSSRSFSVGVASIPARSQPSWRPSSRNSGTHPPRRRCGCVTGILVFPTVPAVNPKPHVPRLSSHSQDRSGNRFSAGGNVSARHCR